MNLPCPPDANISEYDYSDAPDNYDHAHGAKIWLVPSECWNPGSPDRVTIWAPDRFLFETDLITYNDTDIAGPAVGTAVIIPEIIRVTVTPTFVGFGNITLPFDSGGGSHPLTITNTGTVPIDIDTELSPTGTVFDANLYLPYATLATAFTLNSLAGGDSESPNLRLIIDRDYTATGLETATLIFWATASQ